MWIVVRRSDNIVVGTQREVDPTPFWDAEKFEVKEYHGCCVELDELDPTLDDPDWQVLANSRVDFDALADKADNEVDWLETAIPQIETATLDQLRTLLQRLARQNLEQIKAWRYLFRRLT